jgi:hypothetical protein
MVSVLKADLWLCTVVRKGSLTGLINIQLNVKTPELLLHCRYFSNFLRQCYHVMFVS